jgi:prepilin-type N-terminal cleavage/methylation domain-containing protein/prepilin-type processing-associated H-X9-DG protein
MFYSARPSQRACAPRAFTLVELLVVIGIIGVLVGVLLPSLSKARSAAARTQCLSNMRSLAIAQVMYASDNRNYLIEASDGASTQGSWVAQLQRYSSAPLVRRCPADRSLFFETPLTVAGVPVLRTCSYAINNYVSPTHFPTGITPYIKITKVPHSSRVIQFGELVETGNNAVADHLHVDQFWSASSLNTTLTKIKAELALGRHDGKNRSWVSVLNYAFLDGHAESLPLRDAYTDLNRNLFDPTLAR